MAYRIRLEGKNKIIAERMLKDIVKICEKCGINYTLEACVINIIYDSIDNVFYNGLIKVLMFS